MGQKGVKLREAQIEERQAWPPCHLRAPVFVAAEPAVMPPWLVRATLLGAAPGENPLTND